MTFNEKIALMVLQQISKTMTKVFGSRNERLLKSYYRRVEQINAREEDVRKLTDIQLRDKTAEFRKRFEQGETRATLLPEIMAVAREAMDRSVGIRNILNDQYGFDPSKLPDSARAIYDQVKQQADSLDAEPLLGGDPAPGYLQVEIPNALYDAVRELYPKSRPPFRARPFDVQLIGGMVLGEGRIAEMKTGEGKTIVGPLACYMACVENLQCHVVTVNDYLVQRDRDWVFPFYYRLGLTVGAIHPFHMQPPDKKMEAYRCDVLYGTNSEFGFDYLRDNMKLSPHEQVQKRRDFCIVDEIDSILIDEARTPLIISGPAHEDAPRYDMADHIAKHLMQKQKEWTAANEKYEAAERRIKGIEGDIRNARDKAKTPAMKEEMKSLQAELPKLEAARDQHTQFFEVEMEKKAAHLTHEGIAEAQKQAGIGSFYVGNNMDFPHLLENALRAHAIYQRDKDYVVKDGDVVIVDEFTGRLMVGRQWSDGLHQAVEAKENVKIKQETQTLATVTIQNFFKLYKRLAGMTGTAITEATEFHEIYELEVVSIPTNLPVIRHDRNDLIFLSQKDKWNAILDEIKQSYDIGRPVLVGTTSVEKSEMLSQMLSKKHGIKHEVLNAKQHERESLIVQDAGSLGSIVIATNMAGRGTDIRLQPIDRAALVRHWQQRNLLPREATAEMAEEQILNLAWSHQARMELGIKPKEADEMTPEQLKLQLLRYWVAQNAWVDPKKAASLSEEQCLAELDSVPDFHRHRLALWQTIEQMGGLHIIGTERHEARRIDNQLRGRAGRQGDRGSSRFFISLEDDLMKMFAGKNTLRILSRLGMKEGDAIEHRMVTRSVEKAQRKVEERNYEIRKNLLDYDEVMEYQRNSFYGLRQEVLEGNNLDKLIFDYIDDAVVDAVETYKAPGYVQGQLAEWCRAQLDVSIDPSKLHLDSREALEEIVRDAASHEVVQVIDVSLGEYMSNDIPVEDWDLDGLRNWAMSRFRVDLKKNRLRGMNVDQVKSLLVEAAREQVGKRELAGIEKFLAPYYGERELAAWAREKFGIEVSPEQLGEVELDQAVEQMRQQARDAYRQREITYPVEIIMEVVFQGAQQDQNWAINQLIQWARQRYQLEWSPEQVAEMRGQDIYQALVDEAEAWLAEGKLEKQIDEKLAESGQDHAALIEWMGERFGVGLDEDAIKETEDLRSLLVTRGRASLRIELSQLEQFVLLQILDQAWKDHLYAMDQLKDSIGLRGYAERDPRIEYKREGANLFQEMQRTVRDRVTELIFRARLTPNVELQNVYGDMQEEHQEVSSYAGGAEPAAVGAAQGTAEQQADLAAAEQAGAEQDDAHLSRKQRRAAQADRRKQTSSQDKKQRKRKSR